MKHAIIVGHPDPGSFTLAMAKTYAETVSAFGHTHVTRDLYRLEFDPLMTLSEMPTRPTWSPAADVAAEREIIGDADVFAFIYPLWFNSPPAIVKGYVERVLGSGLATSSCALAGSAPSWKDANSSASPRPVRPRLG